MRTAGVSNHGQRRLVYLFQKNVNRTKKTNLGTENLTEVKDYEMKMIKYNLVSRYII